jgi:hypothetical protein
MKHAIASRTCGVFLLIILQALFVAACDNGDSNTRPSPVVIEPQPCRFVLSPTAQAVPAAGGTFSFALTTSSPTINPCSWTAASSTSWLTLTGATSGTSAGTVMYAVEANTLAGSRVGTIALGPGGFGGSAQFAVTQAGAQ